MAKNQGLLASLWGQAIFFFIVFFILIIVVQTIFGTAISGSALLMQAIEAAVATVIFILLTRWYRKRH